MAASMTESPAPPSTFDTMDDAERNRLANVAIQGPTIIWDGRCGFCHQAATLHFLKCEAPAKINYLYVQHPFTLWLLEEKLKISYKDAVYRVILLEDNNILRGAMAAARGLQLMKGFYKYLGNFGTGAFVPKSERAIHYETVSENRKHGDTHYLVYLASKFMQSAIVGAGLSPAVNNDVEAGQAGAVKNAVEKQYAGMFLHGDVEIKVSNRQYLYAELKADAGPVSTETCAFNPKRDETVVSPTPGSVLEREEDDDSETDHVADDDGLLSNVDEDKTKDGTAASSSSKSRNKQKAKKSRLHSHPTTAEFSFREYTEAFSSAMDVQSAPWIVAGVIGFFIAQILQQILFGSLNKQGKAFDNTIFTELSWFVSKCYEGFKQSQLFHGSDWVPDWARELRIELPEHAIKMYQNLYELPRWSMFLLVVSYLVRIPCSACSARRKKSVLNGAATSGDNSRTNTSDVLQEVNADADSSEIQPVPRKQTVGTKEEKSPYVPLFNLDTGFEDRYTFEFVRTLMVRLMGVVYLFGFLTSAVQHRTIFGKYGLEPQWEKSVGAPFPLSLSAENTPKDKHGPTPLFTLFGYGDLQLEFISWTGFLASFWLLIADQTYVFYPALYCYLGYLSIVNLETRMVAGFGWEWDVVSFGFILLFLCSPPLNLLWSTSGRTSSSRGCSLLADSLTATPKYQVLGPSVLLIFLMRFQTFKFLLGAGMSKLTPGISSACWWNFTCTSTHYHTQGLPTPFAYYFEHLPEFMHKIEGVTVFFEQLVLPAFFLSPFRTLRIFSGVAELFFQLMLILTGSYAVVNYIAFVPVLAMFDDQFLVYQLKMFSFQKHNETWKNATAVDRVLRAGEAVESKPVAVTSGDDDVDHAQHDQQTTAIATRAGGAGTSTSRDGELQVQPQGPPQIPSLFRNPRAHQRALPVLGICNKLSAWLVFLIFVLFSGNVFRELMGPRPWIKDYDPLYLVNSHGLFGLINYRRTQLVLEYTHGELLSANKSSGREQVENTGREQAGGASAAAESKSEEPQKTSFLHVGDGDNDNGRSDQFLQVVTYEIRTGASPAASEEESGGVHGAADSPPTAGGVLAATSSSSTKAAAEQNGQWKPLEFIGLPGSVDRRPVFIAPYHVRLDWLTWIEVTCGGEDGMANKVTPDVSKVKAEVPRGGGMFGGGDPVPDFVKLALIKIQAGDPNAARLFQTPESDLFYPDGSDGKKLPPTQFRASFYEYEFDYSSSGNWWKRTLLPGGEPQVVQLPSGQTGGSASSSSKTYYNSILFRNYIVGACMVFSFLTFLGVKTGWGTYPFGSRMEQNRPKPVLGENLVQLYLFPSLVAVVGILFLFAEYLS
ncbi:unnamed protein product [Amoebophrya sp. A120]|nr:unnamed protein product [Amoebophrya sp. A120]|eukprot:GSA120T00016826001.1